VNLEEFEEEITKLVRGITDYYDVEVKFEEFEYDKEVIVRIYRRYYEISEYCSEISENEEQFDECMENNLEDINKESSINLELKYTSDVLTIEAFPLVCDGDYCKAGVEICLRFYHNIDYDALYEIVEPLVKVALSDVIFNYKLIEKSFNKILT